MNKAIALDPGFDKAILARVILYHMTQRDRLALDDILELEKRGCDIKADLRESIIAGVEKEMEKTRFRPGK